MSLAPPRPPQQKTRTKEARGYDVVHMGRADLNTAPLSGGAENAQCGREGGGGAAPLSPRLLPLSRVSFPPHRYRPPRRRHGWPRPSPPAPPQHGCTAGAQTVVGRPLHPTPRPPPWRRGSNAGQAGRDRTPARRSAANPVPLREWRSAAAPAHHRKSAGAPEKTPSLRSPRDRWRPLSKEGRLPISFPLLGTSPTQRHQGTRHRHRCVAARSRGHRHSRRERPL